MYSNDAWNAWSALLDEIDTFVDEACSSSDDNDNDASEDNNNETNEESDERSG